MENALSRDQAGNLVFWRPPAPSGKVTRFAWSREVAPEIDIGVMLSRKSRPLSGTTDRAHDAGGV